MCVSGCRFLCPIPPGPSPLFPPQDLLSFATPPSGDLPNTRRRVPLSPGLMPCVFQTLFNSTDHEQVPCRQLRLAAGYSSSSFIGCICFFPIPTHTPICSLPSVAHAPPPVSHVFVRWRGLKALDGRMGRREGVAGSSTGGRCAGVSTEGWGGVASSSISEGSHRCATPGVCHLGSPAQPRCSKGNDQGAWAFRTD